MIFPHSISVVDIAKKVGGEVIGDKSLQVKGVNEVHRVQAGEITFVDVEKYYKKALHSAATIILINKKTAFPEGKAIIVCENPFQAFDTLCREFYPEINPVQGVDSSAVIHESVILGSGVSVGKNSQIGAGSKIFPNVTIYDDVQIGSNVTIHSGSVIGSHAFYYKSSKTEHVKWHNCGSVIIDDGVEIGAGCTIDRGVTSATRIGSQTKIDNHVHVGHGVLIGSMCIIAAQVGIGGKAIIEDRVKLWGQVGISPRVTLHEGCEVYAQSGVNADLEAGKKYFGAPAVDAKEWFSDYRFLKGLRRRLKNL